MKLQRFNKGMAARFLVKTMVKELSIILVHKKKIDSFDSIPAPFIQIATKCYYNHVAIVAMYLGELWILEANSKGFVPFMSLENYRNRIGYKIEIAVLDPVKTYDEKEVYARLREISGKGYDYWSLIWFQLLYIITGKWKGHTGEYAKDKVYCSEAIAYAFNMPEWWTWAPSKFWHLVGSEFNLILESNINDRKKFDSKYEKN
jgi:hypothetical protein